MNIVIIGGGASGLVAAIYLSRNNNVTVLEKNEVLAKKLLATGNGRCNYFNEDFNIRHYRSSNIDILKKIITEENKNKLLKLFDNIGIIPKIKNGCYYPYSNKAVSFYNALLNEVKNRNINVICNSNIKKIDYDEKYEITLEDKKIICDKLVIATGSNAGTNNKENLSLDYLRKIGHSIIEPVPALVKLVANTNYLKKWDGIRSDVELSLYENDNLIAKSKGEAMFTSYGISGICTFDLSGRVNRGLLRKSKEEIEIDFMPYIKYNDFVRYINDRNKKIKNRTIKELFEGMLNNKLIDILLEEAKIKKDRYWNNLNICDKEKIKDTFKKFKITIIGSKGYNEAQVMSGGIPLSEININTMESKIQKNLYILGELLDVDADCGGFNLSFAFLSAIILGENYDKNKTNKNTI